MRQVLLVVSHLNQQLLHHRQLALLERRRLLLLFYTGFRHLRVLAQLRRLDFKLLETVHWLVVEIEVALAPCRAQGLQMLGGL